MTKIKVCGLTNPKEADYLNEYGVDFAGFVMDYPKSKRNISIEQAEEIMAQLKPEIKKVAVLVSPTVKQICTVQEKEFDYIQIHGPLTKESFDAITLPILRAFNVNDMDKYKIYKKCSKVHGYVFDGLIPGGGKLFDWNMLKTYPKDEKLLILAGGLNCDNVVKAIAYVKPDVVDVSSGVEGEAGKDKEMIKEFVRRIRNAE